PGTLEEAGIATAGTLILSVEIEDAAELIRQARIANPKIRVLARCAYLGDVEALRRAGAKVVAAEAEVAIALAEVLATESAVRAGGRRSATPRVACSTATRPRAAPVRAAPVRAAPVRA